MMWWSSAIRFASEDEIVESPPQQAWEMPLDQWLGKPTITSPSNAKDLRPNVGTSNVSAAEEPFLDQYTIKRGKPAPYEDFTGNTRTSWPTYSVFDGENLIASYDGNNLVVTKPYRRRGIATELVRDYRTNHPDVPVAATRTKASQQVQMKAHRQMIEQALREGKPVPAHVLQTYPDLRA